MGHGRNPIRRCLATTAVLVGLVGCGDDKPQPEDGGVDGVRATIVQFIDAVLDSRGQDACELMTAKARKQVGEATDDGGPDGCESVIKFARSQIKDKEADGLRQQARTVKITVKGERATAAPFKGESDPTILVREKGRWLVAE